MDFLKIPPIGFGPGICGYSAKMKSDQPRIQQIMLRRYDKYVSKPRSERQYVESVSTALQAGFRLIDYSSAYGDGKMIGQSITKSGVERKDIFLTTRVSNWAQREHKIREEFFRCLDGFGTDYVDLLQFHWPVTGFYLETWREMEKLYEEGYVKHLGVANCHQHHLEEIFGICKYRPEIGQFEIHPLFTQKPLIEFYKANGIAVEAYTPVARYDDRLVRLPLMKRLEEKYNKSFAQIVLRWQIQNGCVPIIRSMNQKHIKDNFDVFDFVIEAEDMLSIDAININSRLRFDPDNCDFSIL